MAACDEPHGRPRPGTYTTISIAVTGECGLSTTRATIRRLKGPADILKRYAVELLTSYMMSNHWHMVVRPGTDDAQH
jgi:hypothetical protein